MAHCIQAVIGPCALLRDLPRAVEVGRCVELTEAWCALPAGEALLDHLDVIYERHPSVDGFLHLRGGLVSLLSLLSLRAPVAYVETVGDGGHIKWGIGKNPNITTATLRAVLAAFERHAP